MDFKTFRVLAIVFFFYVVGAMLLVPESWLLGNMTKERDAAYRVLGEPQAQFAEARAQTYFQHAFVDSGVMRQSFATLLPSDEQIAQAKGFERKVNEIFPIVKSRLQACWTMVYQLFLRVSISLVWWPLAILLSIPVLVDAIVIRKVKATTFGLTSPQLQMIALRLILIVMIAYVVLLFAPITIHPLWVPAMLAITCASTWMGMTQFVKRG